MWVSVSGRHTFSAWIPLINCGIEAMWYNSPSNHSTSLSQSWIQKTTVIETTIFDRLYLSFLLFRLGL